MSRTTEALLTLLYSTPHLMLCSGRAASPNDKGRLERQASTIAAVSAGVTGGATRQASAGPTAAYYLCTIVGAGVGASASPRTQRSPGCRTTTSTQSASASSLSLSPSASLSPSLSLSPSPSPPAARCPRRPDFPLGQHRRVAGVSDARSCRLSARTLPAMHHGARHGRR